MSTTTLSEAVTLELEEVEAAPRFTSARHGRRGASPVEPSDAALANEAQRINVPLNPRAWDQVAELTQADRDDLCWFHQHCLDQRLSGKQVADLLGRYDRTNAVRILKGTYAAGKKWGEIMERVRAHRAAHGRRPSIGGLDIEPDFVPGAENDRLWHGLEYAARGGFALLAGPSGAGKTKTCLEWEARHPGRMIRINAPVVGGPSALLANLAVRMGLGWRKANYRELHHAIGTRLGPRNVLVIDQGSRLIPDARKIQAKSLEELMDLSEESGCGIVIPLTWRAVQSMGDLRYQIEQITGRAEIFRAPDPTREQIATIARQFGDFSQATLTALHALALKPGALRTVVKVLNAAHLAARKLKRPEVGDDLVKAAMKARFERMGGEDPFGR